jgi:hypothetical protein
MQEPNKWVTSEWANRIDGIILQNKNEQDVANNQDYLVDLYHLKEIARLLTLENIQQLRVEFAEFDIKGVGLNMEEFVLLLLKIIRIDNKQHIQFLVNGIRCLYNAITTKYNEPRVTFKSFLNYYFVG